MDAIGSKEIAAGVEPAHWREKAATIAGGLAHDVSILFGVGRHFGSQPGAKVSMTIMRAPPEQLEVNSVPTPPRSEAERLKFSEPPACVIGKMVFAAPFP